MLWNTTPARSAVLVGTRSGAGRMWRPCAQYISLKAKKGKEKTRKPRIWHNTRKQKNQRSFLMYRLRQMEMDDKVCEQIDISLLEQVYPKEVIERSVKESEVWASKERRVRQSTGLSLVWFVIGMALWSRQNQGLVWQKLVGKLSDLHPAERDRQLNASALSGRHQA